MFDKTKIADALTKTRLYGSPLVLFPLLLSGRSTTVAFVVAILLILTDAFDGIAARRFTPNRSPEEHERGAQRDENADGMLTNMILGGVAANFVFVQHSFRWSDLLSWSLFMKTAVVLIGLGAITISLMVATKKLPMPWCKWVDILNALYYGFLLSLAMTLILGNTFGWTVAAELIWEPALIIVVLGFVYAKRGRLFDRDDSKYEKNPKPVK